MKHIKRVRSHENWRNIAELVDTLAADAAGKKNCFQRTGTFEDHPHLTK
jgi:hypothetical protein